MSTILVADDEEVLRQEIAAALGEQGYQVLTAADGAAALALLREQAIQLVITDLRMPKSDGLELLSRGRACAPETLFVIMTAFGSLETAIEALRAGAADYLIKPLAMDELLIKVQRLMENVELRAANRMLRRDLDRKLGPLEMVGGSPGLEKIRGLIQKVAPTRSAVLITGESGTGKELIVRALHALGAPKGEPFVPVNCAAIPETLLESELFGHQKGAFTGALAETEGLFRSARKGTLFLDEIGDLPLSLQAKLLRVLEDKKVQPVGSTRSMPFEARVVAATHRNLPQAIREKTFREDLYYRLAVVELYLPPLRERREDIPQLVNHLLRRFNRELNRHYTGVDQAALQWMLSAPWKGNIRELQNVLERAMIVGSEPLVLESDLVPLSSTTVESPIEAKDLKEAVRLFERAHIRRLLALCGGDKRAAADAMGISLSSLYRYLEESKPETTSEVSNP